MGTEPTFTLNELLTLGCVFVRVLREHPGTVALCGHLVVGGEEWRLDLDVDDVDLSDEEQAVVKKALWYEQAAL